MNSDIGRHFLLPSRIWTHKKKKLKREQVSIDWAHRVLISSIREQRMLKMMALAGNQQPQFDAVLLGQN